MEDILNGEKYRLIQGDCLEVMKQFPDNSIDAIVTDPPYYKVKGEWWDRQWDTVDGFIAWIGQLCEQWQRILKPNGSLYVFASPKMSARVEVEIGRWFNVMNNIRWVKTAGWHNKTKKESLRMYLSPYESIIFAEHFFEPLRLYIRSEWERAGLTPDDANKACNTANMAGRHFFTRSQWCLPTEENYLAMRKYAHEHNHGGEYLRREYEDLRRPFSVTADVPYTDVWDFPTVQAYAGKHPCEKPQEMLEHIVKTSTKPGAVVMDCFAGSGSTGSACIATGRRFVGIELDPDYFAIAKKRIENAYAQPLLFEKLPPKGDTAAQSNLL